MAFTSGAGKAKVASASTPAGVGPSAKGSANVVTLKSKIQNVSAGKGTSAHGVVMGTTMHKPGANGFSHHGIC